MEFQEIRAPRHTFTGRELTPSIRDSPPFNYDVAQNLINSNRNISNGIPNLPTMLLRWFSDRFDKCQNASDGQSNRLRDVLQSAQIAESHFQKLAEFGIAIPNYTHLAIGQDAHYDDAVALYTTVEKLSLTPWDAVDLTFVKERVFKPILLYAAWLQETNQPYLLLDVGWQLQYGLVANTAALDSFDVYLMDIEPVVGQVTPTTLNYLVYESIVRSI